MVKNEVIDVVLTIPKLWTHIKQHSKYILCKSTYCNYSCQLCMCL